MIFFIQSKKKKRTVWNQMKERKILIKDKQTKVQNIPLLYYCTIRLKLGAARSLNNYSFSCNKIKFTIWKLLQKTYFRPNKIAFQYVLTAFYLKPYAQHTTSTRQARWPDNHTIHMLSTSSLDSQIRHYVSFIWLLSYELMSSWSSSASPPSAFTHAQVLLERKKLYRSLDKSRWLTREPKAKRTSNRKDIFLWISVNTGRQYHIQIIVYRMVPPRSG